METETGRKYVKCQIKEGKKNMGEFIGIIVIIGITIILCNGEEWKAQNRLSPPGKKSDWATMNRDLANGLNQIDVYKKFNRGKYDIDN